VGAGNRAFDGGYKSAAIWLQRGLVLLCMRGGPVPGLGLVPAI
jgi:hypothetical protein